MRRHYLRVAAVELNRIAHSAMLPACPYPKTTKKLKQSLHGITYTLNTKIYSQTYVNEGFAEDFIIMYKIQANRTGKLPVFVLSHFIDIP